MVPAAFDRRWRACPSPNGKVDRRALPPRRDRRRAGGRLRGAAHAGRGGAGRDLGRGPAASSAVGAPRRLLRAGRPLAPRHPGDLPRARAPAASSCRCAACSRSRRLAELAAADRGRRWEADSPVPPLVRRRTRRGRSRSPSPSSASGSSTGSSPAPRSTTSRPAAASPVRSTRRPCAARLREVVRRHEACARPSRRRAAAAPGDRAGAGPCPLPLARPQRPAGRSAAGRGRARPTADARRPFDLAAGPLLRGAAAPRRRRTTTPCCFDLHHIVADGWSLGILPRELAASTRARRRGSRRPAGAAGPVRRLRRLAARAGCRPSARRAARLVAPAARRRSGALDLPTDRPRPAVPSTGRAPVLSTDLPAELAASVPALAARRGRTLFMRLLAAFATLLVALERARTTWWSARRSPTATAIETEGLIGFFVNTLALRVDLAGDPAFRDLLERVREAALGGLRPPGPAVRAARRGAAAGARSSRHAAVPGRVLRPADAPAPPAAGGWRLGSCAVRGARRREVRPRSRGRCRRGRAPLGEHRVRTDLFDARPSSGCCRRFVSRARGGRGRARDGDRRPAAAQRGRGAPQIVGWSRTPVPSQPSIQTISGYAARPRRSRPRRRTRSPSPPASEVWTYAELAAAAERLAAAPARAGVGPETRVALCLERSPELVIAALAVLKRGRRLLPLDPDATRRSASRSSWRTPARRW